jgi:hypothetical protein
MTTKPRIAIVIGSTPPGRYADKAAGWMLNRPRPVTTSSRNFSTFATIRCRSSMRRGRLYRPLARTPRHCAGRKRSPDTTGSFSWWPNTTARLRVC